MRAGRRLGVVALMVALAFATSITVAQDSGKQVTPVRISALERIAVLDGLKTVIELVDKRPTMVLGNIAAGRVDDDGTILVCGYVSLQDYNGKYYDWIPFMGAFVPSAAAFINKTFAPYSRLATGKRGEELIANCRALGLAIN